MNPFVTNQANLFWHQFLIDPPKFNLSKYLVNASIEEIDSLRPKNPTHMNDQWLSYILAHPKFNDSLRRQFSFWPELLFDCHFGQIPCNSSEVLEHFYHVTYGNCFRFNGNKEKRSLKVGREGDGFGIGMFIGASDHFYPYNYQSFEQGVKVFITERDVIPISQPGTLIKPGTTALINVKKNN